ncbi:hypothetical protein COCON_G00042400 [Conger conger]|uniref:Uncharacterized protein n=1 Tax=Conger conger TaxID=82655 RepID=A0A9Q1DTY4_CONCO|nr:hypothetical protein COCON_G00042400 [Conger conger]
MMGTYDGDEHNKMAFIKYIAEGPDECLPGSVSWTQPPDDIPPQPGPRPGSCRLTRGAPKSRKREKRGQSGKARGAYRARENKVPAPLPLPLPSCAAQILKASLDTMERHIQRLENDIQNFPKTEDKQDKFVEKMSISFLWV